MTETYDVTLDGTGYMVKPGTYQRYQDGQSEGRVGRVRLFDFYGGAMRNTQLERDRFLGGAGAWPTLDSQGIIAGPKETDRTLTVSPAMDPTQEALDVRLRRDGLPGVRGRALLRGFEWRQLQRADGGAGAGGRRGRCLQGWGGPVLRLRCRDQLGTYNLSTSTYTAAAIAEDASLIGRGPTSVWYVDPADAEHGQD